MAEIAGGNNPTSHSDTENALGIRLVSAQTGCKANKSPGRTGREMMPGQASGMAVEGGV